MSNATRFEITAIWDEEEKLWLSQSNIRGLHIETETFEEFEALAREFASELIVQNHYRGVEIDLNNLKEWIPSIVFRTDVSGKPA
ncbi:MAG: DUF1902 domain-containing protein [Pseudomonadota bacterium]